MLDLIAGDDRNAGIDTEHVEGRPCTLDPAAGGDRPRDATICEVRQELASPDQPSPGTEAGAA
jgi:hypothetical protein